VSEGRIRTAGRRTKNFVKLIMAAGFGALAWHLFDPDRGRARRAQLADQAAARVREGVAQVRSTAEYQKGVAKGAVYKMTEPLRRTREFDEETLIQKVRSEALGPWKASSRSPGEVEIATGTTRGQIILSGIVGSEKDHAGLLEMVREVSGVDSIDDRISVGSTTP
jgi:osmotically-inducible protein OsmY